MTAPTPAPAPKPGITYRPNHERHQWLRAVAYAQHRSIQSIIDEAIDRHREAAQQTAEHHRRLREEHPHA